MIQFLWSLNSNWSWSLNVLTLYGLVLLRVLAMSSNRLHTEVRRDLFIYLACSLSSLQTWAHRRLGVVKPLCSSVCGAADLLLGRCLVLPGAGGGVVCGEVNGDAAAECWFFNPVGGLKFTLWSIRTFWAASPEITPGAQRRSALAWGTPELVHICWWRDYLWWWVWEEEQGRHSERQWCWCTGSLQDCEGSAWQGSGPWWNHWLNPQDERTTSTLQCPLQDRRRNTWHNMSRLIKTSNPF